jgi:hypothetical protein
MTDIVTRVLDTIENIVLNEGALPACPGGGPDNRFECTRAMNCGNVGTIYVSRTGSTFEVVASYGFSVQTEYTSVNGKTLWYTSSYFGRDLAELVLGRLSKEDR